MCIPIWSGPLSRIVACAVLLSACGSDSSGAPPDNNPNQPPPDPIASIDITIPVGASTGAGAAFNPSTKTVTMADPRVRWINADISGGDYTEGTAVVHRIVPDQDGAFTPSGNLGGNATHTVTFAAPGSYPYHCSLHPAIMTGTVVVNP
ncbi:MAG TPA: plastocyanin/azurin family copper-binding protein [Gemmatimonadales bacterium]|nr:plastocyanin/azurin family copper-binding protein [Gemmatimonadales bacterium]